MLISLEKITMIGILYDETSIMYCAPVKETFRL